VDSPLMVNVDLMALIGITRGGRTRSPTIRLSLDPPTNVGVDRRDRADAL
jgi:hypothetical protein